MDFEEKIISEQTIYPGKILTLKKYGVALPDGGESVREEVEHHGGAAILAVDEGCVYLVKQYRLSMRAAIYEIPAGKLEKGEDPLYSAKRELEEETGLRAEKWTKICTATPSPGYTNELIHIYRAEGFEKGKAHLDKDEFLSVEKVPLETAYDMIEKGEIYDAKTLVALLYLKACEK